MKNSSINILIADDDNDDVLMLTEALQDNLPSCKCIHKQDGIAALRHIKTDVNPDIVFLDVNMPLKDGINCLKDIYNHNLLPTTPIVIWSTSQNMKDIKIADEYGAAFYIIKPTSFSEFKKIIKRAIELLGKPKSERVDKSNFVLRETSYYN
ncbi:response regulator [Segetibacter koreensis]|uniref:response regulator n=1 Tax=Segetibacter koreensis TaxID=398037 RepID=UPI00037910D8|nr:response regulator [Segetibacter koreensis]